MEGVWLEMTHKSTIAGHPFQQVVFCRARCQAMRQHQQHEAHNPGYDVEMSHRRGLCPSRSHPLESSVKGQPVGMSIGVGRLSPARCKCKTDLSLTQHVL